MADVDVGKTVFRKQSGELGKGTGTVDEDTVGDSVHNPARRYSCGSAYQVNRQHQVLSVIRQRAADST